MKSANGLTGFNWSSAAARLLKAEIARADISHAQLASRLQGLGVRETESSVKNKLYRGSFAMTFFLQCMRALGHSTVDASSVLPPEMPTGRELDNGKAGKE